MSSSCLGNKRPDLYRGATKYSSWIISLSVYQSSELLQDDQIWRNVKSLTIYQRIPGLSRGFYVWAWETIENRCPNLQELTFIFRSVMNTKGKHEVLSRSTTGQLLTLLKTSFKLAQTSVIYPSVQFLYCDITVISLIMN
jgi:hypothetical protein